MQSAMYGSVVTNGIVYLYTRKMPIDRYPEVGQGRDRPKIGVDRFGRMTVTDVHSTPTSRIAPVETEMI